ncbi:CopG family transcriptional regulator [Novosphingobium colocasiae]|uniref:CopG family transcriptional regulator n=1 Tax=Novosphingobium colocasiae TaxID=1256513 RepID=UPI0035AE260B
MTRILADLPDEDIRWLDARAVEQGKSRASILREAVATYKAHSEPGGDTDWIDAAFGLWKDRTDIGDAVEWQRRERASWTRPWDDDYEEVKAEFPELFDADDDRQRQIYLDMQAGRMPDTKPPLP